MDETKALKRGQFTLQSLEFATFTFPGYTDGSKWQDNGETYECPYFEEAVALEMVDILNEHFGDEGTYSFNSNAGIANVTYKEGYASADGIFYELKFPAEKRMTEDGEKTLFPIGQKCFYWTL